MARIPGSSARIMTAAARARRDEWDEDPLWDDEQGTSWTKHYVGGQKLREYMGPDAVDQLQPEIEAN